MNVLYLISNRGHGVGGHSNSLLHLVEGLSETVNATVLELSKKPSMILSTLGDKYSHEPLVLFMMPAITLKVIKILAEKNIDFIHCFDDVSFLFGRIASLVSGVGIVHTKCGGPNPRVYYPSVENMILYSKENFKFFSERKSFVSPAPVRCFLIPNRVSLKVLNNASITRQRKLFEETSILMVSRITRYYEKKINQAVCLLQTLKAHDVPVRLSIVGVVEDFEFYEELKSRLMGEPVMFYIDEKSTSSPVSFLSEADLVVGSGRSAMEAAVLGKIVFVPDSDHALPVILSPDNSEKLLNLNFSERFSSNIQDEDKLDYLMALLNDRDFRAAHLEWLSNFSSKNFDLATVKAEYLDVYNHASPERLVRIVDVILNFLYTIYICSFSSRLYKLKSSILRIFR